MSGWRPPHRRDHYRVEPGDAIGISIRIPVDRLDLVADLLSPHVARARVLGQDDFLTIYPTIGRGTLNGRSLRHRWVNVISDPPAPIRAEDGIGGLACIGAPSNAINRMWRRQGLALVPGRVAMSLDASSLRSRIRIATTGGVLTVAAGFDPHGEPWEVLPQHYYLLDPARQVVFEGNEWGTTHEGRGRLEFRGPRGIETLDVRANLDLDLGWDYTL